MINWSLERAPVTVKYLIWVQMACLISDFGQFCAVLIFFPLFKVVPISIWSITVSCHWIFCSISYGFVRFQTVVSRFIWFHLILTVPSIFNCFFQFLFNFNLWLKQDHLICHRDITFHRLPKYIWVFIWSSVFSFFS